MKKKYYSIYILPLILSVFLTPGCSDLQSDVAGLNKAQVSYHGEGITDPSSPGFHGNLVRDLKWNMKECETCHGADLSGSGNERADCRNCHTAADGPESCNTCHGTFSDPSRSAPPRDISEKTSVSFRGVGAHASHTKDGNSGADVKCSACHNHPDNIYAAGHMINDELPAEVLLKETAVLSGAGDAGYDYSSGSCSNVYCHGNFEFEKESADPSNRFAYTSDRMEGLNRTVNWTKVNQGEAECGSCHGLPPEGHISAGITVKDCYTCHRGVVDENGNILNRQLHINGIKDVRGN